MRNPIRTALHLGLEIISTLLSIKCVKLVSEDALENALEPFCFNSSLNVLKMLYTFLKCFLHALKNALTCECLADQGNLSASIE